MPARDVSLALFGGVGAAVYAAETAERRFRHDGAGRVVGLLNDREPLGSRIHGYPVVSRFDDWCRLDRNVSFLLPLHKVGVMPQRYERVASLEIPSERLASVLDPTAIVHRDCAVGPGLLVGPYAMLQSGLKIGSHVSVRNHATVGHETVIGDFAFIGHTAVVCGYCSIGKGAYIAPGALIREGVSVGDFATIGLGSIVLRDVPAGVTIKGGPSKRENYNE